MKLKVRFQLQQFKNNKTKSFHFLFNIRQELLKFKETQETVKAQINRSQSIDTSKIVYNFYGFIKFYLLEIKRVFLNFK